MSGLLEGALYNFMVHEEAGDNPIYPLMALLSIISKLSATECNC